MRIMTLSEVKNSASEWPFFTNGELPRLFLSICPEKEIEPEFWVFRKDENEKEAVNALLEKGCNIFPVPSILDKAEARDLALQCKALQDPEEITALIIECIQKGCRVETEVGYK